MIKRSSSERRRSPRAKRILSIEHRLYKRRGQLTESNWHISTTENISDNGLLFVTSTPYQIDDLVELHVVKGKMVDIFHGYGKVIRISRKNFGVVGLVGLEFCDLKSRSKNLKSKNSVA